MAGTLSCDIFDAPGSTFERVHLNTLPTRIHIPRWNSGRTKNQFRHQVQNLVQDLVQDQVQDLVQDLDQVQDLVQDQVLTNLFFEENHGT